MQKNPNPKVGLRTINRERWEASQAAKKADQRAANLAAMQRVAASVSTRQKG